MYGNDEMANSARDLAVNYLLSGRHVVVVSVTAQFSDLAQSWRGQLVRVAERPEFGAPFLPRPHAMRPGGVLAAEAVGFAAASLSALCAPGRPVSERALVRMVQHVYTAAAPGHDALMDLACLLSGALPAASETVATFTVASSRALRMPSLGFAPRCGPLVIEVGGLDESRREAALIGVLGRLWAHLSDQRPWTVLFDECWRWLAAERLGLLRALPWSAERRGHIWLLSGESAGLPGAAARVFSGPGRGLISQAQMYGTRLVPPHRHEGTAFRPGGCA
jgi:hypothetical protein